MTQEEFEQKFVEISNELLKTHRLSFGWCPSRPCVYVRHIDMTVNYNMDMREYENDEQMKEKLRSRHKDALMSAKAQIDAELQKFRELNA